VTWGKGGPHSGYRHLADKDEVPGSSPGRPTTYRRRSERCRHRAGRACCRLGPRWGRTPIPPAPPVAPPGPPTRAAGSATTTNRGRTQPRTPATRRLQSPRAAARSRAHRAAARDGRSRAPAWPAWSLSGQARPPRPTTQPGGPGPPRPPTDQRDLGSVATAPRASWTVARAVDGPAATGPPPVPVVTVARPPRPGPPTPLPEGGGDGRVRTDGGRHQTAGRWRAGQRTAERRTLWTTTPGDRTPDGWTAGSRTPTPDGVDTACWTAATDAVACLLAGSTTAATPDRSLPAGRCSGPTSSGRATTRTTQPQALRGHPRCDGRVWPPPRPSAAGGTPASSWRLGALLSSVRFRGYCARQ